MQAEVLDQPASQASVLVTAASTLDAFWASEVVRPFDESSIEFIDQLSQTLLANCQTRFPDLYALGFWFRKSHMKLMRERCLRGTAGLSLQPKGLVFQVAPGNVDSLFLYSGLLAFLMGNRVAIRVSSRQTEQFRYLVDCLNQLLSQQTNAVASRWLIFACDYQCNWLALLSARCDLRVLWGGDESINAMRQHSLNPAAKDISFAQRYSLLLVNAESVLATDRLEQLLSQFQTDVFSFSQQACSSPKCLVWQGDAETVARAKTIFWQAWNNTLGSPRSRERVKPLPEELMLKIERVQQMAVQAPIRIQVMSGCLSRADIDPTYLNQALLALHPGYGLLLETRINALSELTECLQFRYQTLSYFGYERTDILSDAAINAGLLQKVDRVVPLGKANEFDELWDGYDLLHEFCRVVRIQGV
jgi:hypothetical protein